MGVNLRGIESYSKCSRVRMSTAAMKQQIGAAAEAMCTVRRSSKA